MCAVSMVGDGFSDHWKQPKYDPIFQQFQTITGPTKAEFDELKKEVELMKKLLIKAKLYDEQNNEPNCEMDEKIEMLKKVAKLVGVDLEEIFKPKSK